MIFLVAFISKLCTTGTMWPNYEYVAVKNMYSPYKYLSIFIFNAVEFDHG